MHRALQSRPTPTASVPSGSCGEFMVRAAQGHSMTNVEDERLLESLIELSLLPEVCVHGTYTSNVSSILQRGLLAGGLCGASQRKHVHFALLEPRANA